MLARSSKRSATSRLSLPPPFQRNPWADLMPPQIVDSSNTLRDSWINLGQHQFGMAKEYQGLYDPIACAVEGTKRSSQPTPELQLSRTFNLTEAYSGLKDELTKEVVAIDTQIIDPATDARKCLAPIKKTIKKRE